jgi:hypothetical protein
MPVQWIIADVDGCLTPEESIAWDLERFAALARRVREASQGRSSLAPLTLCTGRPQPYAEVLMKLLDVRAPAICENGAVFYTLDGNRAWFARGVTEEKLLGLRAVRAFIETELLPAQPAAVLQFGKESQISVFSDQPEVLSPMQPLIEDFTRRRGGPELVINRSHYYLNISLAGLDKGAAIAELLEMLAVGRDQVAGIGDTEGDLPLRAAVSFFACPANARPAIKTVADYVSPHPLLEGVLDILSRPEFQRA